MAVLDQYDFKILQMLIKDGRVSFSNIAKEIGISDVAVKKRFERLISKKIIKQVSLDIGYDVVGFQGLFLVLLKANNYFYKKIMASLKAEDFVKTIYRTTGDFNISFFYLVPDMSQIELLDNVLTKLEGVIDFKILIVTGKEYEKDSLPLSSLQVYYRN